jgi:hypothetical protein
MGDSALFGKPEVALGHHNLNRKSADSKPQMNGRLREGSAAKP